MSRVLSHGRGGRLLTVTLGLAALCLACLSGCTTTGQDALIGPAADLTTAPPSSTPAGRAAPDAAARPSSSDGAASDGTTLGGTVPDAPADAAPGTPGSGGDLPDGPGRGSSSAAERAGSAGATGSEPATGRSGTSLGPDAAATSAGASGPGTGRADGAAAGSWPPPTTPRAAALASGQNLPAREEAAVVRLVNDERSRAGCRAVTVDPILVRVARAHSKEMTGPRGFRHNSPDGRTPFQRMTAAGYRYSLAAENIAAGQPTPQAVMAAWMASPGHRANILDCRLTEIGVGVVTQAGTPYRTYWTQDFGTPM